jgi:hypothetical protein
MTTVKVPKLVYDDISIDEFRSAALKMNPDQPPKYQIGDVVYMITAFKRQVPAVVLGLESRQGKTWLYHVAIPRDYDGRMERVQADDDALSTKPNKP